MALGRRKAERQDALSEAGLRTYILEPERGRQRWEDQPIHVGASNLSLLMRTMCGIGKPKTLQDLPEGFLAIVQGLWRALERLLQRHTIERGPDVNTRADPIAAAV